MHPSVVLVIDEKSPNNHEHRFILVDTGLSIMKHSLVSGGFAFGEFDWKGEYKFPYNQRRQFENDFLSFQIVAIRHLYSICHFNYSASLAQSRPFHDRHDCDHAFRYGHAGQFELISLCRSVLRESNRQRELFCATNVAHFCRRKFNNREFTKRPKILIFRLF